DLRVLHQGIDTTTPAGRLFFHLVGALAEFERDLISERTRDGLDAARARGRVGGRPRGMTPQKATLARQMYDTREHTVAVIARTLGVSRASIYRHLGLDTDGAGAPAPAPAHATASSSSPSAAAGSRRGRSRPGSGGVNA